jgi:hypothetical protein
VAGGVIQCAAFGAVADGGRVGDPEQVQYFCHRYVDLLHLIDMPDGWKIVNAAWRMR